MIYTIFKINVSTIGFRFNREKLFVVGWLIYTSLVPIKGYKIISKQKRYININASLEKKQIHKNIIKYLKI